MDVEAAAAVLLAAQVAGVGHGPLGWGGCLCLGGRLASCQRSATASCSLKARGHMSDDACSWVSSVDSCLPCPSQPATIAPVRGGHCWCCPFMQAMLCRRHSRTRVTCAAGAGGAALLGAVPGRTSAGAAASPVPLALNGLSGVHRRPCLAKASALRSKFIKLWLLCGLDGVHPHSVKTHLKDRPQFSHCCRLTFSYWWYMASLKASMSLALLGSAPSAPKPTGA